MIISKGLLSAVKCTLEPDQGLAILALVAICAGHVVDDSESDWVIFPKGLLTAAKCAAVPVQSLAILVLALICVGHVFGGGKSVGVIFPKGLLTAVKCALVPVRGLAVLALSCSAAVNAASYTSWPRDMLSTQRRASSYFFTKISRLRCARDLGRGIGLAPPCSHSTPVASLPQASPTRRLSHSLELHCERDTTGSRWCCLDGPSVELQYASVPPRRCVLMAALASAGFQPARPVLALAWTGLRQAVCAN